MSSVQALNQILAIIDEKAAKYQNERHGMPQARAVPEKKLILDLIEEALKLTQTISPKPINVMQDLQKLRKQLEYK